MPRVERSGKARKTTPAKPPAANRRGDAMAARGHSDAALSTLVAIMTSDEAPAAARSTAANAVLDRAWGKPRQDLDLSSAVDAVAAIQRARQRVHRLHEKAAAETKAADDTGNDGRGDD